MFSQRLFIVLVFVFQGFIWSQSRYQTAAVLPSSPVKAALAQRTLWRRSTPLEQLALDSSASTECRPSGYPLADQCKHITEDCQLHPTFLSIDYLHGYFCAAPATRPFVFTGLLLWLLFLFSTLGISASDFFTPNLATLAQILGLNENVAGVTFLAFGNGSPDLFSTFSAMKAGSGGLAVGELLGAASFIVSCVVGSMCIIKPFRVERGPFLRDVGFFTLAVMLVLVILWDGKIHLWESSLLIGVYLSYVTYVVVSTWLDRRRQRRQWEEQLLRSEYLDDSPSLDEPYRDEPSPEASVHQLMPPTASPRVRAKSSPPLPRLTMPPPSPGSSGASSPRLPSTSTLATPLPHHAPQMPSFSIVGALEFRQVVASLQTQSAMTSLSMFESPITPYAGGHYHSRALSISGSANGTAHENRARSLRGVRSTEGYREEVDPWDESLGDYLGGSLHLDDRQRRARRVSGSALTPYTDEEPTNADAPELTSEDVITSMNSPRPGSLSPVRSGSPSAYLSPDREAQVLPQTPHRGRARRRVPLRRILKGVYHTLLPSLHEFRSKTFTGKVVSVFAAPAIMALTLTLPVVVTPRHDDNDRSPEKPVSRPGLTLNEDGAPLIDFEDSRRVEEREGERLVIQAEDALERELHHGEEGKAGCAGNELGVNKWLTAVQCILAPLWCVGVLFAQTRHVGLALVIGGVAGACAATMTLAFASGRSRLLSSLGRQWGDLARCSMGFFVSIVWIMAIADEVVNVLQTFGFIFGLSDAIIGLTIFAVGNSLADLVANMSVAVFAPIMGFSACFGGPMLNILLGIGISGTYIISHGVATLSSTEGMGVSEGMGMGILRNASSYDFDFSRTLMVSTIGVLVLLVATLVFVPMNDYFLSRRWGWTLVGGYVVIMCVNVWVELHDTD